MNLPDGLLSPLWTLAAFALFIPLLLAALWRAPWQRLSTGGHAHVFFGTGVAVLLLWSLKAGVLPGLNFHILGTSLLTLMFGVPLAIIASTLVLAAVTVNGLGGWQAFAVNALLLGVLPAAVTWGVWRAAGRWLPRQLFVYIFVCGFFGAALAMATTGLASSALFVLGSVYALDDLLDHYLPYFLLMVFPEAILTGSFVALLAVYRPQWIWSYDEDLYLRRRD